MTHGGSRKGAGRKPVQPLERRVTLRATLPRWLVERATEAAEQDGRTLSEWLEDAVIDALREK